MKTLGQFGGSSAVRPHLSNYRRVVPRGVLSATANDIIGIARGKGEKTKNRQIEISSGHSVQWRGLNSIPSHSSMRGRACASSTPVLSSSYDGFGLSGACGLQATSQNWSISLKIMGVLGWGLWSYDDLVYRYRQLGYELVHVLYWVYGKPIRFPIRANEPIRYIGNVWAYWKNAS
jgi:hypothetical protein